VRIPRRERFEPSVPRHTKTTFLFRTFFIFIFLRAQVGMRLLIPLFWAGRVNQFRICASENLAPDVAEHLHAPIEKEFVCCVGVYCELRVLKVVIIDAPHPPLMFAMRSVCVAQPPPQSLTKTSLKCSRRRRVYGVVINIIYIFPMAAHPPADRHVRVGGAFEAIKHPITHKNIIDVEN
jgi:hypothetical protein